MKSEGIKEQEIAGEGLNAPQVKSEEFFLLEGCNNSKFSIL